MKKQTPLRVGIVGCGNIAGPYARDMQLMPELELVGVTDLDSQRAEQLAAQHDCRAYHSLDALLADDSIDLVVNLTVHHAHYAVTKQCLLADKHVHSEKPLAMTYREAAELVALADERGLRLSASPFTVMGEAQQTAWREIRSGRLGTVRIVYAEVNWGRIEVWHPAPQPFYEAGALFDVGVYPLMILTTLFGRAQRVWSYGTLLKPERVTKHGDPYTITTPDWMVTMLEMESGPLVRLTTNFYVPPNNKQGSGIEFHGDKGSLHLSSWSMFNADVSFAPFDQPYESVSPIREPFAGLHWGYCVREVARAIAEDRPHRSTGEQAAHLVEILEAAAQSAISGQPIPLTSTFTPPQPLEYAQ